MPWEENEEDEERCRGCGGFNDGEGTEDGYCADCRPDDEDEDSK